MAYRIAPAAVTSSGQPGPMALVRWPPETYCWCPRKTNACASYPEERQAGPTRRYAPTSPRHSLPRIRRSPSTRTRRFRPCSRRSGGRSRWRRAADIRVALRTAGNLVLSQNPRRRGRAVADESRLPRFIPLSYSTRPCFLDGPGGARENDSWPYPPLLRPGEPDRSECQAGCRVRPTWPWINSKIPCSTRARVSAVQGINSRAFRTPRSPPRCDPRPPAGDAPRSIATSFDRRIRPQARAALPNADSPSSLALMMSVGTVRIC